MAKIEKAPIIPRFLAWPRRHLPEEAVMLVAAAVIGCVTGFATFVIKLLISQISAWCTRGMSASGPNYLLLALPVAGIILVSMYQRYWLHTDLMHGDRHVEEDLHKGAYNLSPRLMYAPGIATSVTLGLGGSAGAEGPSATIGSAVGSNVGRWLGLTPEQMRLLIGCGAGAGIAGIFKAPIGGALFTLEVMGMAMTTGAVIALVVAALCGGLTCYALTGFTSDISYHATAAFDPMWLIWIAALGVFCGLYSAYYARVMRYMGNYFARIRNPWLMNIIGGVIVGGCIFLFPALYGEGYGVVTRIVNGDFSHLMDGSPWAGLMPSGWVLTGLVAAMLMLKCWACVASNSAGGVAGDFAPTIFAGALAGYVFATVANMAFGLHIPVGVCALMGCAGVFAGAIQAPLMAMFIAVEMTGYYSYLIGFALVALISYAVARRL